MDNKKQMQLRLFFNRSLSEKMTMDMITVISQHINTTEIVQAPNTNNQFYIPIKEKTDNIINYNIIISTIVIDYIRNNYVMIRRLYDKYAYENREFKDCVSKDDIQLLLHSESNNFVFNILQYDDCISVIFG